MNSNFLKNILFFLIILFIVTVIAIIIIMNYKNKQDEINLPNGEEGENLIESYGKNASGGIDYDSYFDVKACMQRYLNNINVNNSEYVSYDEHGNFVRILEENQIKQKIFNLLSNKYINEKNVTIENLYDNIKVIEKEAVFVPLEISLVQDGNIKSFLVCGLIESVEDYSLIDKIFAIVNIDIVDYMFSIEPIYGYYNNIDEIKIEQFEDNFTPNADNEFNMVYPRAKDIVEEYIERYKQLALGFPEMAYELLNEEYRNSRFGSLEEFKKYVQENRIEILSAGLVKYKINFGDNNKATYICTDQNENYYIINEKEILQDYNIMLDKYTINLSEFNEKYDSSDNNIKVALNIEKLIEAAKYEDYKYVYSKLDETFKTNNFKTLQVFENYMKGKFDAEEDIVEYKSYKEVADLHVYNIEVMDISDNKTINAKVVMDLKDNRDFVFSFSAE